MNHSCKGVRCGKSAAGRLRRHGKQAVHGEEPAKAAAHLRGLQVVVLHSLEGVTQRLGQRAHEHILRLPQGAVFRPYRIALGQLLLCCACTKQLI